ncbi:MAG: carbamoyl phosphate synthase small subunit [Coriobacteriia bacterium]|nr:carbamoyl phosphate synthase small subunit [Coriobacteriia bacterium]
MTDVGCGYATLVLEDGTCFTGRSCGADGEVVGELCFNTSMIAYTEVISNPAYAGSILVMTYPQMGNHGVVRADLERDNVELEALVLSSICDTPSSFRMDLSLREFLAEKNVVALEGIDTRELVRHICMEGSMPAIISTLDHDAKSLLAKMRDTLESIEDTPVARVSTEATWTYDAAKCLVTPTAWTAPFPEPCCSIVAIDNGLTRSVLRHLAYAGCATTVVPWDATVEEIWACEPDGVFVSGGPGDPQKAQDTVDALGGLLGELPILGLGSGQLLLALAAGGVVDKMQVGHNGDNIPVMDLVTHQVSITAQNHRHTVRFETLGSLIAEESGGIAAHPLEGDLRFWAQEGCAPVVRNERFGRIQLTHVNVNDGTAEGLRFLDIPALSLQYHPALMPGAQSPDAAYAAFIQLMEAHAEEVDALSEKAKAHAEGTGAAHA